mmetsp:Transcript_17614/g.27611  ORF Transcript_17614/g.27611 Transcript_17614/m.27611 type:complete len:612 (-) Transcript_17614:717-2552(-)|eukprot:CAMPEP_0201717814 /NCGR_PEP_ID=MMETSP0593-20130828/3506_1 /ASSEMBLY_ACC=CAM_ASM_000672 /TAXON_ID=267983 /ORGANISM="Skeletonema japonicum, Strain CCMP2506" /LENGTH=611 /DNA_ID=CAMNT_0048207985 /DNA_START=114 /DNA_END=1949 /DNA_ORIENTATION=+
MQDLEAQQEDEPNAALSLRPRRSSYARETIIQKIHSERRRHSSFLGNSILSPVDYLMGPGITSNDDFEMWQRHEDEQQKKKAWFIILHHEKFRLSWDALMAIILSICAFYIPYRVCFFWEDDDDAEEKSIFIFESTIDLIFLVDIVLNFVTTYRKQDVLITNPKQIVLHYLRGYFFIDLIATIPFGYILTSSSFSVANKLGKLGRLPKLIKFVRAARLLKLLRVYRLHEFIVKLEVEYNIHHGYSRMVKIVTLILLVTHMVGCFWFLIGISGGGDSSDSWNQGWVKRENLDLSPRWVQYISAMYWAFSTLTTVGYGDISARTPQEQTFSMVMMLVGVTWYAFIVSSMSTIMSSFDAKNKALREKMLCVNEFIRTTKLPRELAVQVRGFFEFKAKSKHVYASNNYDVDELLDELGSGLRADILMHLERDLIEKIPFLQDKVPQFVADCVSMFSPMVFNEGDFIVKEGTQADEMYFLVKGTAGVFLGSKLAAVLNEGSYFGEIGCIMGGIRRASVKALTLTELQALSRRNLNILLVEYPSVADELKQVARDRASIASRGKSRSSSSASENEADDDSAEANKSSTSIGNPIESEIDRMVDSISVKLRKELKKTL